jgi:hypothetical protein
VISHFGAFVAGFCLAGLIGHFLLRLAWKSHLAETRRCRGEVHEWRGAWHESARALARKNRIIKRLRSNADRLRSIACAKAFQVGVFDAYLEREHRRAETAVPNYDWTPEFKIQVARAHELGTIRFVFQGVLK